ncbi:MAG TPA: CopG family antitoxin, partial [Candidatus Dormibacteraeota bacterium]|nr:CopG family antitoxin [Candidatus Dormibacteraeota bacterium]
MSEDELDRWSDAQAEGPWESNDDVAPVLARPMTSITVRMPQELLSELKAEAALRRQPYQRYMKDLLLLALRQVQADHRRRVEAAQVRLTDEQIREL